MRITESQLRRIVREEILSESMNNRSVLAVMKRHRHPAVGDKLSIGTFLKYANTVYNEFEVRDPSSFKFDMEDPEQFGGLPEMPLEFYVDLVAAMRRDQKSYFKSKEDTSYMPGYRD